MLFDKFAYANWKDNNNSPEAVIVVLMSLIISIIDLGIIPEMKYLENIFFFYFCTKTYLVDNYWKDSLQGIWCRSEKKNKTNHHAKVARRKKKTT